MKNWAKSIVMLAVLSLSPVTLAAAGDSDTRAANQSKHAESGLVTGVITDLKPVPRSTAVKRSVAVKRNQAVQQSQKQRAKVQPATAKRTTVVHPVATQRSSAKYHQRRYNNVRRNTRGYGFRPVDGTTTGATSATLTTDSTARSTVISKPFPRKTARRCVWSACWQREPAVSLLLSKSPTR